MSDIVERIREVFDDTPEIVDMCDESYEGQEIASHLQGLYEAALEAADRIEKLEAALEAIADHDAYGWTLQTELAYAALGEEKTDD